MNREGLIKWSKMGLLLILLIIYIHFYAVNVFAAAGAEHAALVQVNITGLKSAKVNQVTVTWKNSKDTSVAYELQYSKDAAFGTVLGGKSLENTGTGKATFKTDQGGTTVYVRIRAIKKDGKKTLKGKWSSVKSVRVKTAEISLSKKTASVKEGKSLVLKASVSGTKEKVLWSSRDTSIASVDSLGKVTGNKPGITTIVAKIGNKKALCRVTVYQKALSGREKALNAFHTYLADENSRDSFCLVNTDKDTVPELLHYDSAYGVVSVVSYRQTGRKIDSSIFGNAVFINSAKSIIITRMDYGDGFGYDVYRDKKQIASFYQFGNTFHVIRQGHNSVVTKAVYEAEFNKYLEGTKRYTLSGIKYKNTEENLNKYLK